MDSTNESGLAESVDFSRFAPAHSAAFQRTLVTALGAYKAEVLDEFCGESEAFLHFLRLTVNEAEGLAWSTPYAHLLLPALVEEKTQTLRRWASHQHRISPGLHPVPVAPNDRK